jgi:hypothetical protein
MRTRMAPALAVSLVLLAAGCGSRATPSEPTAEEAPKSATPGPRKLTLHFKDWT